MTGLPVGAVPTRPEPPKYPRSGAGSIPFLVERPLDPGVSPSAVLFPEVLIGGILLARDPAGHGRDEDLPGGGRPIAIRGSSPDQRWIDSYRLDR